MGMIIAIANNKNPDNQGCLINHNVDVICIMDYAFNIPKLQNKVQITSQELRMTKSQIKYLHTQSQSTVDSQ